MSNNIKLFVGLGNPGADYDLTRHNAGFMFLEQVAKREGISFSQDKYTFSLIAKAPQFILAKPTTFMNSSGKAVKALADKLHLTESDIYVVHDDLDVRLGEYKVQQGRGPKDHNGISSIEDTMKTSNFWRVRIGIDNRDPYNRIPGENYVLQKFEPEEVKGLTETYIKLASELIGN